MEKENKKKKEEPKKVMANEDKVDLLLQMLSTADATIESSSENDTIVELESMAILNKLVFAWLDCALDC